MQKSLATLCLLLLALLLSPPTGCEVKDTTPDGLQTSPPDELTSPAEETAVEVEGSLESDDEIVSQETSATATAAVCEDKIPLCSALGFSICTAYELWARYYCARSCGVCHEETTSQSVATEPGTGATATGGPVTDNVTTVPHMANCCVDPAGWRSCISHMRESCETIYLPWAHANCPAFCGFCQPCPLEPCVDENPHCSQYGLEACTSESYRLWAYTNCRKTCRLCYDYGFYYKDNPNVTMPTMLPEKSEGTVPTAATGATPTAPGATPTAPGATPTAPVVRCSDLITRCDEFGKRDCEIYPDFMGVYCSEFCGFCSSKPVEGPTTTVDSGVCEDKMSNCTHYSPESCCGIYEPWARAHCASYCGFCGVPPPRICNDTITYCDREPEDLCTKPSYELFRIENCAGFCKVCETPWVPPNCTRHLYTAETTEDTADLWTTGSSLTPIPA